MRSALVLAALALALPACGEESSGARTPGRVEAKLTVTVKDGATKRATLTCRSGARAAATGFLRDAPRRHCRTAKRLAGFLAAVPSPHRVCTQLYGGPQTALVKGRIGRRSVGRSFHRRDGCGIDEWHTARDLLGGDPKGGGPARKPGP